MKWFCLVGLLLLGVSLCRAGELESNELQDIDKHSSDEDFFVEVKDVFEKKCRKIGGDDAAKGLTKVIEDLKVCLAEHLPKNKDELKELQDSGSSEELCSATRGKVRDCFDGLVEVWQDCSEPEEKYLPEFVFDAIEAVYDYICADDGAVILKIFDPDTLECIMTLAEKENVTEVCNDKLKFLNVDNPEDITITKAELCTDIQAAKICYGDYIHQQCPKDSNFKDIIVGLYTAIGSPCTKDPKNPLHLNLPS